MWPANVAVRFSVVGVASTLQVHPAQLRAVAAAEAQVSALVSNLDVGPPLAGAAGGVPGLHSAAACEFAGALLAEAVRRIGEELDAHAGNLATAADHYFQADDELGRRMLREHHDGDHSAG